MRREADASLCVCVCVRERGGGGIADSVPVCATGTRDHPDALFLGGPAQRQKDTHTQRERHRRPVIGD